MPYTFDRCEMKEASAVDVLIVGAGPTGMMLAATLRSFGVRTRIVDRLTNRAHESRALVVHARSLEIFQNLGMVEQLLRRGNTSRLLSVHLSAAEHVLIPIDDIAAVNTEFPYILFVSQAETEAVLDEHLSSVAQIVERGVEVVGLSPGDTSVTCTLRDLSSREEFVRAAYVVGCDGAHSFVRKTAALAFEGDVYPQTFVLGDVEVDGALTPDALNLYFGERGLAVFFPLGHPTTWRIIGIAPPELGAEVNPSDRPQLTLAQLQAIVDVSTTTPLRLRDPDWLANFRLHHRQAVHYRSSRLFLAGDAAHVHSPAGGQGMNTGMQDAWNLGWKLALVVQKRSPDSLLDSYEAERWPVGRFLLRYTDRLFAGITRLAQAGRALRSARTWILSIVLPRVVTSRERRARGFRIVSQLAIRYRRSTIVSEGSPGIEGGPKAGDRFPDAPVTVGDRSTWLQRELRGPKFHLLLCGPLESWDDAGVAQIERTYGDLLSVRHLVRCGPAPQIADATGAAHALLCVRAGAQYLVRPDGYIGYRSAGLDIGGAARYLAQLLTASA